MDIPPVPTPPSTVPSRRRRSPPSAIGQRPKRHSPNNIALQPASPQVISSLIDSLSAISGPAYDHFENFPSITSAGGSAPSTPLPRPPESSHSTAQASLGGASQRSSRETPFIYLDDAAEPPVVRTSKPPSGLSPITAPKPPKKERASSLRGYLSSATQSTTSLCSVRSLSRDRDDASSIGNVTIDARADTAPGRTSAESKRSARAYRGLMYMSSRERLRSKESERKRLVRSYSGPETSAHYSGEHLSPPKPTRQPPSPPPEFLAETPIEESHEEPVFPEPQYPPKLDTKGKAPVRDGPAPASLDDSGTPAAATSPGFIPERQSSLKQQTATYKKSHSQKSSRNGRFKTKPVIEEEESPNGRQEQDDFGGVESQTTKRIRELKKQMQLREKRAGKKPVGAENAGERSGVSHVSPIAGPPSPPTSSDSSLSEKRPNDSSLKAHKILGLAGSSSPPKQRSPSPERQSEAISPKEQQDDVSREVHAHEESSEDHIPLPINYQLALQTLERQESNPSTKSSIRPPSLSSPSRIRSVFVGGRSAVSRKHHSVMALPASPPETQASPPPSQRLGSSVSTSMEEPRQHTRTRSQTIQERHQSLQLSPTPTRSITDARARKKKRWSHPDLPLKAIEQQEKRLSRRESEEKHAVKPPSHTIKEDRPESKDSIIDAVEAFLDAPRLSQRVRHPQSGRVISFSEVGDPKGFAVFCCVGMGLTRYVMAFYDELASTLKLRLITLDRPGIGGSQGDDNVTPLTWTDDILTVCQKLGITKFSLLAHSAGAVYALAAALRMPQHIRGRVHLLAPWIPPSQMAPIGVRQNDAGGRQLPRAQRFLRALPPSLLKIANSSFLSATSASITRSMPKSPQTKRKSVVANSPAPVGRPSPAPYRESMMLMDQVQPNASALSLALRNPTDPNHQAAIQVQKALNEAEQERRQEFDERLTFAIWDRATTNANPATDLIVCLETRHTIGFRYEDITRGVVIHHGSKDTRVPVDNVRWLGRIMRRCEVRVLEGESHGLMANPIVMGNLLMEVAKEWEDWTAVVEGSRDKKSESPV